MRKKIIDKLRRIKRVRNSVRMIKKAWKFLGRIHKRKPGFIFHSPKVSLSRSYRPFLPGVKFRQKISDLEKNAIAGITLHKDVLLYPLKIGIEKDYLGGLVDSKTHRLIEDGVHLRVTGQPSQELQNTNELPANDNLPEITQVVLFGGILYNHFGHFLLESLGRLWAYDYVKDLDPYILFYNDMGEPNYLEKRNFIYQVLSGFNIPHKKIIFVNFPAKLKQVIIPVQKYGYELCKNPDEIFLKFIHSFRLLTDIPKKIKNVEKIYVSRSRIRMGRLIGENFFEEYLRNEGYQIFHPELYTIHQQLSVYNNAKKIIFCDGAALHACILLPDLQADVAVVARRRDHRWPCRNITDQFQGFGKPALWIDFIKEQYQFGLESWLAISTVDWYEVSKTLKNEGFVEKLCQKHSEVDFSSLTRTELHNYITTINKRPEYTDFLIQAKEQLPAS